MVAAKTNALSSGADDDLGPNRGSSEHWTIPPTAAAGHAADLLVVGGLTVTTYGHSLLRRLTASFLDTADPSRVRGLERPNPPWLGEAVHRLVQGEGRAARHFYPPGILLAGISSQVEDGLPMFLEHLA